MTHTAEQEREAKPCPVCEGIKTTWGTIDHFWICDRHVRELINGDDIKKD